MEESLDDYGMSIHGLFPIPIGMYNIGRVLTAKELAFLNTLDMRPNEGNNVSINNAVLKSQKLNNIREFIDISLKNYIDEVICPNTDLSITITQSWVNYTDTGAFHHKHVHPNSYISGVFYVQANKQSDKIIFYRETYPQLYIEPKVYNEWNSASWWVPVGSGDLILFPSSTWHGVDPVETERRVSLSFNTFPIGTLGNDSALNLINIRSAS